MSQATLFPGAEEPAPPPPPAKPAARPFDACPVKGCTALVPLFDPAKAAAGEVHRCKGTKPGGHILTVVGFTVPAANGSPAVDRFALGYTGKRWHPTEGAKDPSRDAPDPKGGVTARDVAMVRGSNGASTAWLAEAERVIRACAARGEFTSDDVWAGMTEGTRDGRALGGAMESLRKRGVITPTERFRPTNRAAAHRRPIRVWVASPATD